MTEPRVDDGSLVDTCEDIISDNQSSVRDGNSDDSQVVGLKGLSIESASTGDSEAPLSQGSTSEKELPQKTKRTKHKSKKASQASPGATHPSGLEASLSPSASLAILGSQYSTPILPSTPDETKKRSYPGF